MNLKRLRGLNEHRLKRYRERLVARMKAAKAKTKATDLQEEGQHLDLTIVPSDMHVCATSPVPTNANSAPKASPTNAFPVLPGEVPSSSHEEEGDSFTRHHGEGGLSTFPGAGNGDGIDSLVSMSSMQVNDIVEPEKETVAPTNKDAKGHSPGSNSTRASVKLEPRTTRSREAAAGREAAEATTERRRSEPLRVP
jgi:hypothetical protein